MTRQRLIRVGLIVGLLALLAILIPSREPSYDGRTLRDWLHELARNPEFDENSPAPLAIRHIGTNGLPILLAELRYKDSTPKRIAMKLNDWIGTKLERDPVEITSQWERRAVAAKAIQLLGPDATSAIPALAENLSDPDLCADAAWVLAGMGEPARSILLQNATATNYATRIVCATVLPFYTNNAAVVTSLQSLCSDPHPEVRQAAASSLGIMRADPETTVPLLINLLGNTDYNTQRTVCNALGRFGSNAAPALPLLSNLLSDSKLAFSVAPVFRKIGPASLPFITNLLTHEEADTRAAAVRALPGVGETNTSTVLQSLLHDPSPVVRRQVVIILANGPIDPTVWLPPLIEALKLESDKPTRQQIHSAIRGFGEAARPALPVLTNLISQTTGPEREELLITVAVIDLEAAKSLGASKEVLEFAQWLKSNSGPPGVMPPPGLPPPPR